MSRRIELVVETLVLEGMSPVDRDAFAAAIAAELGRLVESPAVHDRGAAAGRAARNMPDARDAGSLGVAVARAVHARVPRGTLGGEGH